MTIKLSEKEQAGYDVLRAEMSDELAMEIVEYRRERKAKITARIARTLLKEYKAFGDIEKAFTIQTARNWISFECEWVRSKARTFHDTNNPMPAQSANYGRPEPIKPQEPASAKIDPERRRQIAELARQAVRTVQ